MKYSLFISFLVSLLTSNLAYCQVTAEQLAFSESPNRSDNLIIERKDGQKIKLTWPYGENIKKNNKWEQLLDDFQSDFTKVVENIPSYDYYGITYLQKQNLVVDEVRGKETYTVNENNGIDYVRSNSCSLRGKNIKLSIEFNEKSELLHPSLKTEIESAISEIKSKFYISSTTAERHYYSVNSATILPNPKPKLKFFVSTGARLGMLKDKPYIELRPGLGLTQDKKYYFTLNWNFMTQYNALMKETEYDSYIGLTVGSIGAGFGTEVAFKVKSGINDNDKIYFRGGVNYRTKSGILIGADYYLRNTDSPFAARNLLFGFHVGFGF